MKLIALKEITQKDMKKIFEYNKAHGIDGIEVGSIGDEVYIKDSRGDNEE